MTLPINNICHSLRNGPGRRLVIWTQGCNFHCPGCFNPDTHPLNGGENMDVERLAERINTDSAIDGITISGGEPLLHAKALEQLLYLLTPSLTKILYSGYSVNEIANNSELMHVIRLFDLAIMGRYEQSLDHPYLGKKFMKMTDRVDINYFKPNFFVEYSMNNGQITKTGIFKTT